MHPSFKSLIHTIMSGKLRMGYDLVTSTLPLIYSSNNRAIINKRHWSYPVVNLLVTRVPISRETSIHTLK